MSEVRFKIEGELHNQLAELRQVGGFDSVGAAVKSLIAIYASPTLEAIKRGQQAIASGGIELKPTVKSVQPTHSPAATVVGFGEALGAMLKP
jgi:hypothetical protein